MNAWDKQLIPGSLTGDICQPQEQELWPQGYPQWPGSLSYLSDCPYKKPPGTDYLG